MNHLKRHKNTNVLSLSKAARRRSIERIRRPWQTFVRRWFLLAFVLTFAWFLWAAVRPVVVKADIPAEAPQGPSLPEVPYTDRTTAEPAKPSVEVKIKPLAKPQPATSPKKRAWNIPQAVRDAVEDVCQGYGDQCVKDVLALCLCHRSPKCGQS